MQERKLLRGKIGIPSKATKKKIKTRMENSTGNANKKNLREQAQMICWHIWRQKKKRTQEKITI